MADCSYTTVEFSEKSGSYTVDARVSRDIVTADVLDYDGYLGNYALIWKKITIKHNQSQVDTASGSMTDDGYEGTPYGDMDWLIDFDVDDNFTSRSTRTVEFYLTYKVNGTKVDTLLCTCTMLSTASKRGATTTGSQTFEGERVWGCSIQVYSDFIVYQFRKEEPVDGLNRNWSGGYDGNYSFESWMIDRDENPLWKFKKHVVGLINIADGFGSVVGYIKEKEYAVGEEGSSLSSSEVYSVGVI